MVPALLTTRDPAAFYKATSGTSVVAAVLVLGTASSVRARQIWNLLLLFSEHNAATHVILISYIN